MNRSQIRLSVVDALQNLQGSPVEKEFAQGLLQPEADVELRELGLESLDAVEWCMEIEARTGVDIDPATYSGIKRLSDLVAAVESRAKVEKATVDAPVASPPNASSPLSFAQERVWAYSQDLSTGTNYIDVLRDRLRGPLDTELLRDCIERLVARHELLRTAFTAVDGQKIQAVQPVAAVECPLHLLPAGADPHAESMRISAPMIASFRDFQGKPLARFALLRISETEHWLIRVWHHLLYDAESCLLFMDELAELYDAARSLRAPELPETDRYADFAAAQKQAFDRGTPAWQAALAWYKERFATPSYFRGPALRRRKPNADAAPTEGKIQGAHADAEMMLRLDSLKHRSSVTSSTIWLAAASALTSFENNEPDIVIGTYVTHRRRAKFQHTIGDFTNMVVLRLRCDRKLAFSNWLSTVQDKLAVAEKHSAPPYHQMIEELHARKAPIPDVQMIFSAYINFRSPAPVQGIEFSIVPRTPRVMPWGFDLMLRDQDGRSFIEAKFDAVQYDPAQVRLFLDRLHDFLDAASRNPDATIAALA